MKVFKMNSLLKKAKATKRFILIGRNGTTKGMVTNNFISLLDKNKINKRGA
jgi:hypothetical protein